jgi:hypothetical protein
MVVALLPIFAAGSGIISRMDDTYFRTPGNIANPDLSPSIVATERGQRAVISSLATFWRKNRFPWKMVSEQARKGPPRDPVGCEEFWLAISR